MGIQIIHKTEGDYTVTTNFSGLKTGTYNVDATANRNIVTADVLDYDGNLGNYALIWKKITIAHTQNHDIDATGSKQCEESTNPMGCSADPLTYSVNSIFRSTCTRTVEFYLTYKINGQKFEKLLCTCTEQYVGVNSSIGGVTSASALHSYDGTRVWGVSIQVSEEFIVYQFRKEIPSDKYREEPLPDFGDHYDSCYGLESWNTDKDEHSLWKLQSFVVGLINIKDGVGSEVGYLKEEEYTLGEEGSMLSRDDIYSVGVVNT